MSQIIWSGILTLVLGFLVVAISFTVFVLFTLIAKCAPWLITITAVWGIGLFTRAYLE